jgi:hypothetical protein
VPVDDLPTHDPQAAARTATERLMAAIRELEESL